MGKKTAIKIFGQQRTGTNYLQSLLELNYPEYWILENEFCDKHQKLFSYKSTHPKANLKLEKKIISQGVKIISLIMIKNPYSWFNSMKSWRAKCQNPEPKIADMMPRYNNYYSYYHQVSPQGNWSCFEIIKYEDLLESPQEKLSQYLPQVNLIVPDKVKQSTVFTDNRKKFYLGNQDPHYNLSKLEINKINDYWDKKWDYEKIIL